MTSKHSISSTESISVALSRALPQLNDTCLSKWLHHILNSDGNAPQSSHDRDYYYRLKAAVVKNEEEFCVMM